jgi:hypothetical protein
LQDGILRQIERVDVAWALLGEGKQLGRLVKRV